MDDSQIQFEYAVARERIWDNIIVERLRKGADMKVAIFDANLALKARDENFNKKEGKL